MALDDRIEPVEQPAGTVGADTAVLDMAVVEQLGPLAAVGDAVAEENDVVAANRQLFEKTAFLVVVFAFGRTMRRQREAPRQGERFFMVGFFYHFLFIEFAFVKLDRVFQPVIERVADQRMADRDFVGPRDAADEKRRFSRLRSCPAFRPSP